MSSLPWRELRYALWLPLYLTAFLLLETLPGRSYWSSQLPLDDFIPFVPCLAVPYCLWFPLLIGVGAWLWLRRPEAFRRYMRFLAVTFFLSEVIWCFFPSVQNLRPALTGETGLFTSVIAGLYRVDTPTNVFPSVHVVGAIGAALAIQDGAGNRPVLCRCGWVMAALICLSTVCIKQHALLDVLGGLVLSLAAAVPLYRRALASRPLRRGAVWRRLRGYSR